LADIDSLARSWLPKCYLGSVRYGPEGWHEEFRNLLDKWRAG